MFTAGSFGVLLVLESHLTRSEVVTMATDSFICLFLRSSPEFGSSSPTRRPKDRWETRTSERSSETNFFFFFFFLFVLFPVFLFFSVMFFYLFLVFSLLFFFLILISFLHVSCRVFSRFLFDFCSFYSYYITFI